MYESLLNLDPIKINFSPSGMHIINIILAFIMFGVALGIKLDHFKKIFLHPKSIIVAFFAQIFALPFVTFLLVIALSNFITPTVAMGMILVASCPGGNISNFVTHLSKGNIELSVTATAISTLSATFLTPFNFSFWGGLYSKYISNRAGQMLQPLQIETSQMFETVFILLGVPLILGMLVGKFYPKLTEKMKKPVQWASVIFFIGMIVMAFANNFRLFIENINYIFIIVLIHNGLVLGTGYGLARLFKLPERDKRSLTIETGIQNSGLGLVLLFNPKIFPPTLATGGMLFVTAWWGIWHIISGLCIAFFWSRKPIKEK